MEWKRDAGVAEMVRHFNQENRFGRWDLVTKKERQAIEGEVRKCRDNFEYAARNYFWITDKDERDILMSLLPAQELILDKWYELRNRCIERPTKILIIKSRQAGCSTLIDALMTHTVSYNPNVQALLISKTQDHTAELFRIPLRIIDYLPWWMQPMTASRKIEQGLWLENPDEMLRSRYPGLNSKIIAQWANQTTGVGEGTRLSFVHGSEMAEWPRNRIKQIIDGDMVHAMPDSSRVSAFLESTGKGAGTYLQTLWDASSDLGDRAEWCPLFIPMFFEKKRVLPPPKGWRIQEKEVAIRERVSREWLRCDQGTCDTYRPFTWGGEPMLGTICSACKAGTLQPTVLSDSQVYYMEDLRINRERKGSESVKELQQELCVTVEECFQIFGYNVFPQECHDFVNQSINSYPLAKGNFDQHGNFHAVRHLDGGGKLCWTDGCTIDHTFEAEDPLWIWEWPDPREQYVVGVDVAEGMGMEGDYSVAWVNKIGRPPRPDVHVATWRSNTIDPASFALPVNLLGRKYNDALMSIELNSKGDTVASMVRIFYGYPNIYRLKNLDSTNIFTNRWGWVTQLNTKPRLWQAAIKWLRAKLWIVRDPRFAKEMKTFNKEFVESKQASAASGNFDDVLMAAFIALYTSHDLDMDEQIPNLKLGPDSGIISIKEWDMTCVRCNNQWESEIANKQRCPRCGSIIVGGRRKPTAQPLGESILNELLVKPQERKQFSNYDEV